MTTLACAIDDGALKDRVMAVMRHHPEVEVVAVGADPWVQSRLVSTRRVDAFCFRSMDPVRMIEIRRAVLAAQTQNERIRSALLVDSADAASVYHCLGFGFDDVIVLSSTDESLSDQLATFAHGTRRACGELLLDTVDVTHPVIRGVIEYVDETERKIVRLVSVGYTDREIGEILGYSHQVIRNRISQLMLRSGLRNRTQLSSRHTFETYWLGGSVQP